MASSQSRTTASGEATKRRLGAQFKSYLSLRCTHIKGRGGAKATVRFAQIMASQYRYVARFDIRSYYESIDHAVLLKLLEETVSILKVTNW